MSYTAAMANWVAVKLRIDCPECGSAIQVDGPYRHALCTACGETVKVASLWQGIAKRARQEGGTGTRFRLFTFLEAGADALGHIYVALNKGRPPICSSCDEVLDEVEEGVADGFEGSFHCPACGVAHPTWPAPPFLRDAKVRQVFMAPPEEEQQQSASGGSTKPILFACPNCGGKLSINTESPRVCTCEFCDVDSYLPADLWNRLHPVRRRRAFWLRSG